MQNYSHQKRKIQKGNNLEVYESCVIPAVTSDLTQNDRILNFQYR